MEQRNHTIDYPRNKFVRNFMRFLGRTVLPVAFKLDIKGEENFPAKGPLLVVGNHVAMMEAVLMTVFTPWLVEMVGSADIPQEGFTESVLRFYGYIPLRRGRTDRKAMTMALDVLRQGGIVGIFPEGGIWEIGAKKPQTGVAWLSQQSGAPVLPIGFSGTLGALGAALKLKRPLLKMRVGKMMPAANPPERAARKEYLESYAEQVMQAVIDLLPADDPSRLPEVLDENFELRVNVYHPQSGPVSLPRELLVQHPVELAKFLHRPIILKIFKKNLHMPVDALNGLDAEQNPKNIADAIRYVLDYLGGENPYLLTYRFGPKEGEAMKLGLEELYRLAIWAQEKGCQLKVVPIRRYITRDKKEVIQIKQSEFQEWM